MKRPPFQVLNLSIDEKEDEKSHDVSVVSNSNNNEENVRNEETSNDKSDIDDDDGELERLRLEALSAKRGKTTTSIERKKSIQNFFCYYIILNS